MLQCFPLLPWGRPLRSQDNPQHFPLERLPHPRLQVVPASGQARVGRWHRGELKAENLNFLGWFSVSRSLHCSPHLPHRALPQAPVRSESPPDLCSPTPLPLLWPTPSMAPTSTWRKPKLGMPHTALPQPPLLPQDRHLHTGTPSHPRLTSSSAHEALLTAQQQTPIPSGALWAVQSKVTSCLSF